MSREHQVKVHAPERRDIVVHTADASIARQKSKSKFNLKAALIKLGVGAAIGIATYFSGAGLLIAGIAGGALVGAGDMIDAQRQLFSAIKNGETSKAFGNMLRLAVDGYAMGMGSGFVLGASIGTLSGSPMGTVIGGAGTGGILGVVAASAFGLEGAVGIFFASISAIGHDLVGRRGR